MTVFQVTVNGHHDHVVDTDDIVSWVQACNLLHKALAASLGEPAGQVAAIRKPGLTCDVNPMVIFQGQQIAKEDRT